VCSRRAPGIARFGCLSDRFRALSRFPTPDELSALYAERIAGSDAPPLRFVLAPPRRRRRGQPIDLGALYEGRIVLAGEVPTRLDDWHDLFKRAGFLRLPARQVAAARAPVPYLRGAPCAGRPRACRAHAPASRMRLALFDEGGVVVCAAPATRAALPADPDHVDAALTELVAAGRARALLFGHALFEHLAAGLPAPLGYAHVLEMPEPAVVDTASRDALDAVDRALGQCARRSTRVRGA